MIGIDIGSVSIKGVEITGGRGGFNVEAVGVVDTPSGGVAGGMIYEPDLVAEAIRGLLTSNGFRGREAVFSVGGEQYAAVKVIEVPKGSPAELSRTVREELPRHVVFSQQVNTVHDFAQIDPPDADPNAMFQEVLLAAAQEELVEKHLHAIERSGLRPVAIDVESLALCRALLEVWGPEAEKGTTALVNVGAATTEIAVVRDGLLRLCRVVRLGGDTLTTAIGQAFIEDAAQAEMRKRRYGTVSMDQPPAEEEGYIGDRAAPPVPPAEYRTPFDVTPEEGPAPVEPPAGTVDLGKEEEFAMPGMEDMSSRMAEYLEPEQAPPPIAQPDVIRAEGPVMLGAPEQPTPPPPGADEEDYTRGQISQAIMPVLQDLVHQVRITLEHFTTRKGGEVERVILVGGSSKIANLAEFFSAYLGVPTSIGNPFHGFRPSPGIHEGYLADISPMMAVCTGLALRDML